MTNREKVERAIERISNQVHNSQDWWCDDYATDGKSLMDQLLDKIEEIYDLDRNHQSQ